MCIDALSRDTCSVGGNSVQYFCLINLFFAADPLSEEIELDSLMR